MSKKGVYLYRKKMAVITGASSGIGKAYAIELAARGCDVVLSARSESKLRQLATEITQKYKVKTYVCPCDLSQPDAFQGLVDYTIEHKLSVDILINSAGFGTYGYFEKLNSEREIQEVTLNTAALVQLTHYFLQGMLARKEGVIVNVASTAAFMPCPYSAVYGATKAFVLSFTESLWAEMRDRGVRILALCPGATETEFHEVIGAEQPARLSTPKQVVEAGFRGIDKRRSYIVEGRLNYFMTLLPRIFSRKQGALIMARYLKEGLKQ